MTGAPRAEIILRKLSAHSDLNDKSKAALATFLTKPHAFAAGATIADVGDPADIISFVHEGFACRCTTFADGRRQIHAILLPGDAADLEATLLRRRSDQIVALTPCSIWLAPKSRLVGLGSIDSGLADAFAREALLGAEIARQWLVNLGRRSAHQRVAHLLCELSTRLEAVGIDCGPDTILPLRQQHIADALGISTVHANRVFQAMKADGCVVVGGRGFRILNRAPLEKGASFDPAYLHLSNAH